MSKRILLISAAIGGGHVAAAKALEQSCKERGVDALHIDLLDYTTLPFRRFYRQAYFDVVRTAPEFIDWLGKRLDRSPGEIKSRQTKLRARLTRLISYHLPRVINRYQPDIIVHTHFLAPEILSTKLAPDILRRKDKRIIPQAIVITDFFAHSLWLQPRIVKYFVASEEIAVHLRATGVDDERIRVSGIPIDPSYSKLETKQATRQQLAYPQDRDVLLLNASGLDEKALRIIIRELKNLRWPLTVAVICGRSPQLLEIASSEIGEGDGLVNFDLIGYTQVMPRYMAAADLLLGKPGGLTSSEALAAGLPFAIVQPYPLQEEANTSYLLEYGAAMRIEPLTVLNYKLKRFFESPGQRQFMHVSALNLARPEAASTIIQTLLDDHAFS